jgi:hypothetical protein
MKIVEWQMLLHTYTVKLMSFLIICEILYSPRNTTAG